MWPSVGTVRQLQITSRDGAGAWGGRVRTIKIIGSLRTTTVTGTTFQRMFGMRSSPYTVIGSTSRHADDSVVREVGYGCTDLSCRVRVGAGRSSGGSRSTD